MEINAGKYYLRALRADDRIDDRPAVLEGFTDPISRRWLAHVAVYDLATAGAYIAQRALDWEHETRFSWAVADQLTGALLGEVLLKELDIAAGVGEAGCWTHPSARGQGLATEALGAVIRFAFGGLGLQVIRYRHETANTASAKVAARLGFSQVEVVQGTTTLELRNG